ncbi:MAG: M56 family metallopeptidase [Thermoanaerobaculia bacterium]
MSALLSDLLALSLKGTLAAALVALVLAAAGRRLPAALRHGLWLLVFVRLALPVMPASPASLLSLAPSGGTLLPGLTAAPPSSDPAQQRPRPGPAGASAVGSVAPPWIEAASALWFLGLIILTVRRGTASFRLRRHLRRAQPVTDERALRLLSEARRRLGLRRRVALLESPGFRGPVLVGGLRSRIVLPRGMAETLDDDGLRHVLLHELVHVRRLDGATRVTAELVAAAHWFNPFAWYALRRLVAECEAACDAAVLAVLPESQRSAYGRTLLEIAAGPRPDRPPLEAGAPALFHHRDLKRRILMITRYHPISRRAALACALLFASVAALVLTDAPARAGADSGRESAPATAGEPAPGPGETDRARRTMDEIRNAGTALFSWVTDAAAGREWPEAGEEDEAADSFDWTRCPEITREELGELVEGTYIEELPDTDAWGHPLEFCLDRNPTPPDRFLAGIRSPGRDGVFEGDAYESGSFPASELDRDIVWIDGYFITWASRDTE